jgi:uncharacterized protein (DUF2237 family)
LLARNVPDVDLFEAANQPLGTTMERLKISMLNPIFATHLLDDQLRIEPNRQAADPAFGGAFQSNAQRRPFGHIVGCRTKVATDFVQHLAVEGNDHSAAGGRSWVSPGTSIGEQRCLERLRLQEHAHHQALSPPARRAPQRARQTSALGYIKGMHKHFARAVVLVGFVLAAASPQAALAHKTNVFYGITVHVSTSNIKVRDPKTRQILSFDLIPKFDKVFSANGKTTYQMKAIKPGQYVAVIYDQRALGMRYTDKIYLLNNANQRIGTQ